MSYSYSSSSSATPPRPTSSSPPPSFASPTGRGGSSSSSSSNRRWVEVSGLEYGVVQSVKESYAFILCAEREGELFFHMSDVIDGAASTGVRKGDEVSFVVCHDPQNPSKLFGKRISLLPPGTVHFEEVEEELVQGVIDAELKSFHPKRTRASPRGRPPPDPLKASEGYGGRIRRTSGPPPPDHPPTYEFAERDLVDPTLALSVGDIVQFSVFIEKKSRRRGATAVRLLHLNPTGRQRGVVSNLKEGFGFIRPEDGSRSKELFFHMSSLLDPSYSPAIGDEFEYAEASDGGRISASRITLLPKGSIKADTVSTQRYTGTLEKDLDGAADSSSNNSGSSRSSVVKHVTSAGATVVFPFTAGDCRDSRPVLLQGDDVSFALMTRGKTGEQRAVQVALVTSSTTHRERGVVVTVNPSGGFAFLRRADHDGELFLHASNYKGADGAGGAATQTAGATPFISEGQEVEFNQYVGDNGRPCAVRAVPLPPGSVQFETQWEGRYKATVSKEPKRRKDKGAGEYDRRNGQSSGGDEPRGDLRVTHLLEASGEAPLPTGEVSVSCAFLPSACTLPLLVGDVVECSVAVQRSTGMRVARQIRLLTPRPNNRERGVISQLQGGRGGRISSSSRTALLPFDAAQFLTPEEGKQMQVGDGVEFDVVDGADPAASTPTGRRPPAHDRERKMASRLILLPPGSVQLDSIDRSHSYRGRVEDIPSNPKNPKATPGHIAVLSSKTLSQDSDATSPPPTDASSTDGASPPLPTSPTGVDGVGAGLAALSVGGPAPLTVGTVVPFTFKDIAGHSFLARGDLVEFLLSASSDPSSLHAADVMLLPLTATVSSVAGDNGVALGQLSLMSVSTTSTPSSLPDETLVYSAADVEGSTVLHSGDVVQVSAMSFHAERKRRQAKQIRLVKAAPKREAQAGERRKLRLTHSGSNPALGGEGGTGVTGGSPTGAVMTTMRFARGPDETRGFAPRRSGTQQGIAIGLQRMPSQGGQAGAAAGPAVVDGGAAADKAGGGPGVDGDS